MALVVPTSPRQAHLRAGDGGIRGHREADQAWHEEGVVHPFIRKPQHFLSTARTTSAAPQVGAVATRPRRFPRPLR